MPGCLSPPQGDASTVLVMYEEEVFPPELGHHPNIEVDLQAPAMDHWNVASDKILPLTMEKFQHQRSDMAPPSTQAEVFHPEGMGDGATARPRDRGAAPSREQVLEATQNILTQVHDLHLQSMHKLGSIREMDRTLARTLMAEFTRLQLIINEDLIKSLLAL